MRVLEYSYSSGGYRMNCGCVLASLTSPHPPYCEMSAYYKEVAEQIRRERIERAVDAAWEKNR